MHHTAELGRIYWRSRRYPEAIDQLQQAVQLATALGLDHKVSDYHRVLGESYKALCQFPQARAHLEQALQLAQKANAPGEQIGALVTISALAEAEGHTQSALDYSQRALQVAERTGDMRLQVRCLGKVGQLYGKLSQLPLARRWLEAAVDTQQAFGLRANEPIVPHNLYRLADVLYRQGDYAAAEAHCHRGLAILREHGQTMFQSKELFLWTTTTLAQCWFAQGRQEEAGQQLLALLAITDDPAQQVKIQEMLAQFAS
ncbi:MAG: tetratricopeptide repeat protein [Caldilineaceae bacterium]